MDFKQYQQVFLDVLSGVEQGAPYDQPNYLNYVRLNWQREERWLKTGVLNSELVAALQSIDHEQFWTVITEPWCGDSAHTLPFIHLLSQVNPLIKVDYELRDVDPALIEHFLTQGNRSIPKLIIADTEKNELATWGARPAGCQMLFDQLVREHADPEVKKIAI